MPKDMSVMEQMKNNNESGNSNATGETQSTVFSDATTVSMEALGEKLERYLEQPNGMENTFGPHGAAANGEIHAPACLTGSFLVSNGRSDNTFGGCDQTFVPPGPSASHQAANHKTFYAPNSANGKQNGNLAPSTYHQNEDNKTFYDPNVANGEQNGIFAPSAYHQNGDNKTFYAPDVANGEQNGNFATSAYHQNGDTFYAPGLLATSTNHHNVYNKTFYAPDAANGVQNGNSAPSAYQKGDNNTFYTPNAANGEQNGNLAPSAYHQNANKTFHAPDAANKEQNGNSAPSTGLKTFHFDFDHNVIREPDGSLILNLSVPVINPEAPVERNALIENFLSVFVQEKNPGVRSGVLKAIESLISTNEALVKFLFREDFFKALDEDLTSNLTSKNREFDSRDCIIFGSKLKDRIEKAATGEEEQKMVKRTFQNSSYQLWFFSGIWQK